MKITRHKTRSVFDRYNIVSGDDLREAALNLNAAMQNAKVTDLYQSAKFRIPGTEGVTINR